MCFFLPPDTLSIMPLTMYCQTIIFIKSALIKTNQDQLGKEITERFIWISSHSPFANVLLNILTKLIQPKTVLFTDPFSFQNFSTELVTEEMW